MKKLLLGIIVLFGLLNADAQTTAPVVKPAFKLVFEKTYLHTDRDVYAPGDTLWFKAYLLNAQDNTPAASSGNLHVELISPEAKIINTELIRLNNGTGNGDFSLADTLAPGRYHLRAYTNWMRNFGDNFIFEKEITILNTGQKVAVAVAFAPNKNVTPAIASATASATGTPFQLRFYPEGGSMVEGINAIVAIKAEDGFGKGISLSGAVLSSAGDTVAHFTCDTLGMGLFAILPLKGVSYHAVAKINEQNQSFSLPSALSKGLTLQVRQTDSLMRVVISSSVDPAVLAVKPTYTLTIKHGGITLLSQPLQLTAQQIPVRIPTVSLPQGIAAITLYDENNKPNCERLVYIRPLDNSTNAAISFNKKTYQPKEQVTVQINAKATASLSMAVVDAGVVPEQADDIASYLMLGSEIRGRVEHASRYFDTTNVNRYRQLDMLLMTQGWRDFVWRRLTDTALRISYAAEYNLQIQGRVTEKNNDKPLSAANVSLRADMAVGNKLLATTTDTAGRYHFNNLLQYGSAPVVLVAHDAAGKDAGRLIVDSGQITPAVKQYPNTSSPTYALLTDRAEKQKAAMNVINLKEVKIKSVNYIQLRDTRLTTMGYKDEVFTPGPADKQETIRDYILYVSKQARMENESAANAGKSGDQVRINRIVFYADGQTNDPRLIVDGYELPTSNYTSDDEIIKTNMYNQYFDLPLDKAVKIVIKRGLTPPKMGAPKHGFATLGGSTSQSVVLPPETVFVIYLTLKPGAMDADRSNVAHVQLNGFYQARTFFKPTINPKAADLSTTIHWEPNIKTDAAGKATVSFSNSGATQGRVIVQGITNAGMPVAVTAGYGVK